eukprot:tig00001057_g6690.t1
MALDDDADLRRALAAQKGLFAPDTAVLKVMEVQRAGRKRAQAAEAQFLCVAAAGPKKRRKGRLHRLVRSNKGTFEVTASYKLEDLRAIEEAGREGAGLVLRVGKTSLALEAPSPEQKRGFAWALLAACESLLPGGEGEARASSASTARSSPRPPPQPPPRAPPDALARPSPASPPAPRRHARPPAAAARVTGPRQANTRALLRAGEEAGRLADAFAAAGPPPTPPATGGAGAVEALEARHVRLGALHRNAAAAADALAAALDAAALDERAASLLREGDLEAEAEEIAAAARALARPPSRPRRPPSRDGPRREREARAGALLAELAARFAARARRTFTERARRPAPAPPRPAPPRLCAGRDGAAGGAGGGGLGRASGRGRRARGPPAIAAAAPALTRAQRLYRLEVPALLRDLRRTAKEAPPPPPSSWGGRGERAAGARAVEEAAGAAVGALAAALCAEERFIAAFFLAPAEPEAEAAPEAGGREAGALPERRGGGGAAGAMEAAFEGAPTPSRPPSTPPPPPAPRRRCGWRRRRGGPLGGTGAPRGATRGGSSGGGGAGAALAGGVRGGAGGGARRAQGRPAPRALEPVARFPAAAEELEAAGRGGGEAARAALEAAWGALGRGLEAAVERAAAAEPKHADAARLENYGPLAARLGPLAAESGSPALGALAERARTLHDEARPRPARPGPARPARPSDGQARGRYIDRLLADALPEFSAFAGAAEAALAAGSLASPAELQYQAATSKAALRRVREALRSYEKGVEGAAKRAARHLSGGAGGLLAGVWEALGATLEARYRRFEQLVVQCYGLAERPPEPPDPAALRAACARAYARLSP